MIVNPIPARPSPAWLEYVRDMDGVIPATPGGAKMGTEYWAAPVDDTPNAPAVLPVATAALATWTLQRSKTHAISVPDVVLFIPDSPENEVFLAQVSFTQSG